MTSVMEIWPAFSGNASKRSGRFDLHRPRIAGLRLLQLFDQFEDRLAVLGRFHFGVLRSNLTVLIDDKGPAVNGRSADKRFVLVIDLNFRSCLGNFHGYAELFG